MDILPGPQTAEEAACAVAGASACTAEGPSAPGPEQLPEQPSFAQQHVAAQVQMQQQDPESSGKFALGQAAAAGDSSGEQAGRREAGGAANSEGEEEEGFDAELGTWLAGRLQRLQPDAELDSGSVRVLGRLLDELTARVLDEACRVNAASAACAAADAPADSSAEAGPAAHAGSSGAEHEAGCGHKLSTLTSLDIHKVRP